MGKFPERVRQVFVDEERDTSSREDSNGVNSQALVEGLKALGVVGVYDAMRDRAVIHLSRPTR